MSQETFSAQSNETLQISRTDILALIFATYRATFGYLLIFIAAILAATYLFTEVPRMIGILLVGIFVTWLSWFIARKVLQYGDRSQDNG